MIIANGIERVVFDSDVKSVKNEDVVSAQRFIISWGYEMWKILMRLSHVLSLQEEKEEEWAEKKKV